MSTNQPILGIDLGEKRTGVALAVMPERMAVPLTVLEPKDDKELAERIGELMQKHSAQVIIVGLPVDLNHAQGIAAQKIRERVAKMKEKVGGEWIFVDESYTTRDAQDFLIRSKVSRKRRKEVIDKLAAQNILQSYLDSMK